MIRARNLVMGRKKLREVFSKNILTEADQLEISAIDKRFLLQCDAAIHENLQNESFDVEELSVAMNMSRSNLFRKLKALTSFSPSQYIRTVRLKRAVTLLRENNHNITEIAHLTGFNSTAYFTRSFKEAFGCTPTEYKG